MRQHPTTEQRLIFVRVQLLEFLDHIESALLAFAGEGTEFEEGLKRGYYDAYRTINRTLNEAFPDESEKPTLRVISGGRS